MKTKNFALRIAVAAAFVACAGVSLAVVGPSYVSHKAAAAAAPAVRLPTIVVRPDAQDVEAARAALITVDTKAVDSQAAL